MGETAEAMAAASPSWFGLLNYKAPDYSSCSARLAAPDSENMAELWQASAGCLSDSRLLVLGLEINS